jgi:acetyltransferase-like isoleucine patch superfamily enzyme
MDRVEYERDHRKTKGRLLFQKTLNLIAKNMIYPPLRYKLYRATGIKTHGYVEIMMGCYIEDYFPELIKIEEHAGISFNVIMFVIDDHRGIVAPITISKGAYVGAGSMILPGVIVGENAVVGAGSVVTKDVPPNTVVVGVPAKKLRMVEGPSWKKINRKDGTISREEI